MRAPMTIRRTCTTCRFRRDQHCQNRSVPRTLLPTAAIAGLLLAACSNFDSGSSSVGGGTLVDRAAVDEALTDIAEDRLDGGDARRGVVLDDGDCPVLGDASVAEIVTDIGVDFDLDGGSEVGFLHAAGEGFTVNCSITAERVDATIAVIQTPAFTATEFVDRLEVLTSEVSDEIAEVASFETGLEHDDFRSGSLAAQVQDDAETLFWVDNGLAVAVSLFDGDRAIPRADSLRFLSSARDTVLQRLQGSADGPGGEPGVDGGLDRERLLEAFDEVEPDVEGARTETLDHGPCPFLGDEAFESLADDLGWDVEPGFQGTVIPTSRAIHCRWGEPPKLRSIAISLGRPVSVAEFEAFVEGPIFEPDWAVESLDTSNADLDGRSYVIDSSRWGSAGWVDNGLRLHIDLAEGEDPQEVLSVVVPDVLGELGLS